MNESTHDSIRIEQILEMLSENTASNDRVVEAAGSIERNFGTKAEEILAGHRRAIAAMPAPKIVLPPSEAPAVRRSIAGAWRWP